MVGTRMTLGPPSTEQQSIIANVLGDSFLNAVGVFLPEVLASEVDLNGDKSLDLVAVQNAFQQSCMHISLPI